MARMGRMAIFDDKTERVQALVTTPTKAVIERHRTRLRALYAEVMGRPWTSPVSDSDTIEFMARGVDQTRRYLRMKRAAES